MMIEEEDFSNILHNKARRSQIYHQAQLSTRLAFHKTKKAQSQLIYNQYKSIPLTKRNESNNTHVNNIDASIVSIIPLSYSKRKYALALIGYFFTCGILYICAKLIPSLYVKLNTVSSSIENTDLILIIDIGGNFTLVYPEKIKSFFYSDKKHNTKPDLMDSPYIGNDKQSLESILIFYYKHSKYFYNGTEFEPVMFNLSTKTNKEIHYKYSKGIRTIFEYAYLLNKYDHNCLKIKNTHVRVIFLKLFCSTILLYQLFSITIWFVELYYFFAVITIVMIIITLFITAHVKNKSQAEIFSFISDSNKKIHRISQCKDDMSNSNNISFNPAIKKKVKKEPLIHKDDTEFSLVPGDVIYILPNTIVPCDCLLLDGYCSMNESVLTGENSLHIKSQLPFNDNPFNYSINSNSILLAGAKVEQCESIHSKNHPIALVIATGFNTHQGNLVLNILFPHSSNFKYLGDLCIFLLGMMVITFICLILLFYNYFNFPLTSLDDKAKKQGKASNIAIVVLDVLTVIFPPTIPVCLSISAFIFQSYLRMKNIKCDSEYHLNAAGRVNVVVFDKTGTLTEEGLELIGFMTTRVEMDYKGNERIVLDALEKKSYVYNSVLLEFYKQIYQSKEAEGSTNDLKKKRSSKAYLTSYRSNLVYFVECLATCHSIEYFKGKLFGNCIDASIFDSIKWRLFNTSFQKESASDIIQNLTNSTSEVVHYTNDNSEGDDNNNNANTNPYSMNFYFTLPKNTFKMSEQRYFTTQKIKKSSTFNYNLIILKRYHFISKYQSNSVIIKNTFDNSYRFFIKGAPEKIILNCNPKSIPNDYNCQLRKLTDKGYRVLACATKLINKQLSLKKASETDRELYEANMTFLGFIIFHHNLKKDTKVVIETLKLSGLKLVISTGDNPYTSISVAKECNIISPHHSVCLIDSGGDTVESSTHMLQKDIRVLFLDNSHLKQTNYTLSIPSVLEMRKAINNSLTVHDHKFNNNNSNSIDNNSNISSNRLKDKLKDQDQDKDGTRRRLNEEKSDIISINNDEEDPIKVLALIIGLIQQNNTISLCLSGEGFILLLTLQNILSQMKPEEKKYFHHIHMRLNHFIHLIRAKAVLYYRMTPNDKVELVNFYKEDKHNIIAMCGDGANDSGALLVSDVSIVLRGEEEKGIIFSHFLSMKNTLTAVELVLKNGRTCLENTKLILKYLTLTSILQMTSKIILFYGVSDMTNNQYTGLDCFINLLCCFLVSITENDLSKNISKCEENISNLKFLISILGHVILQTGLFVGYYFMLMYLTDVFIGEEYESKVGLSYLNSYLFIMINLQSLGIVFALNYQSSYKKNLFTNKVFVLYYFLLLFIIVCLVSVKGFEDLGIKMDILMFLPFSNPSLESSKSKILLYACVVLSWALSYTWEFLSHKMFKY